MTRHILALIATVAFLNFAWAVSFGSWTHAGISLAVSMVGVIWLEALRYSERHDVWRIERERVWARREGAL